MIITTIPYNEWEQLTPDQRDIILRHGELKYDTEKRLPAYQHGMTPTDTNIQQDDSYIGETIEQRVEKILNNNEPISDGASPIYTERKDGVDPFTNIRTDRFDLALETTDKITKDAITRRQQAAEARTKANSPAEPGPADTSTKTQVPANTATNTK